MAATEPVLKSGNGKWVRDDVPKRQWTCVGIEDLGEPEATCEMCECTTIRYVHFMEHEDYADVLGCGCICSGQMEGDYEHAKQRERAMVRVAARRKRWLSRHWRRSIGGNDYINTDGFNIVIFRKDDGSWGGRVKDRATGQAIFARRRYDSSDRAKLAAFDAMVWMNERIA